jgi:hypothetical protein
MFPSIAFLGTNEILIFFLLKHETTHCDLKFRNPSLLI